MNAISITDRSRTGLTMTARGTVGHLGWKICDRSTKKEVRREAFQVEANEKDGPEDEVESRNSKCGQYDWAWMERVGCYHGEGEGRYTMSEGDSIEGK